MEVRTTPPVDLKNQTSKELLPAQGAGVFVDVHSVRVSNKGDLPTRVLFRVGDTGQLIFDMWVQPKQTAGFSQAKPVESPTANEAWNVQADDNGGVIAVQIFAQGTTRDA